MYIVVVAVLLNIEKLLSEKKRNKTAITLKGTTSATQCTTRATHCLHCIHIEHHTQIRLRSLIQCQRFFLILDKNGGKNLGKNVCDMAQ